MKILFILNQNSKKFNGGVEKHVDNIRKLLEKKKIENIELNLDDFRGFIFLGHKFINPLTLYKYIININPSIVHIHGLSSTIVLSFFLLIKKILTKINCKIVYTPHFHPFSKHRFPILARFSFKLFISPKLKYINNLICLTPKEKFFFIPYVKDELIHIIPNGIHPDRNLIERNRKKIKNFLFVGRDAHNKNISFLIKLFQNEKLKNFNLNIISNKISKNYKNIFFHNDISDQKLNWFYSKSDVLLVPSTYEAFSIVCLEAIKFGLLLIISENVMIKNYFQKSIFCKILNIDSDIWINEILKHGNLTTDQISNASQSAIKSSKRFYWDSIMKNFFKVYGI